MSLRAVSPFWFSPCWVLASPRGRKSPRCCLEFWPIVATNRPKENADCLWALKERGREAGLEALRAPLIFRFHLQLRLQKPNLTILLGSRHGYMVFLKTKHYKRNLAHKWRNQSAKTFCLFGSLEIQPWFHPSGPLLKQICASL